MKIAYCFQLLTYSKTACAISLSFPSVNTVHYDPVTIYIDVVLEEQFISNGLGNLWRYPLGFEFCQDDGEYFIRRQVLDVIDLDGHAFVPSSQISSGHFVLL